MAETNLDTSSINFDKIGNWEKDMRDLGYNFPGLMFLPFNSVTSTKIMSFTKPNWTAPTVKCNVESALQPKKHDTIKRKNFNRVEYAIPDQFFGKFEKTLWGNTGAFASL